MYLTFDEFFDLTTAVELLKERKKEQLLKACEVQKEEIKQKIENLNICILKIKEAFEASPML